jgi:hypothetical protein
MKSARALVSAGLFCGLAAYTLSGCETGRVNKLHAPFEHASDVTTVPHQNPQFATVAKGTPPVPGSPTAAGANGLQPSNDSEARKSPGTEKGHSMPPREQEQDKFIRQ